MWARGASQCEAARAETQRELVKCMEMRGTKKKEAESLRTPLSGLALSRLKPCTIRAEDDAIDPWQAWPELGFSSVWID